MNTTAQVVTCSIMGGLANQLFQIANVFCYARRNNRVPVLNTSVRESPSMVAPQPTYWDTVFSQIVALGAGHNLKGVSLSGYPEPSYEYREIPDLEGNVRFWGYFLSYKYFQSCRESLLDLIVDNPDIRGEVDEAEARLRARLNGSHRPLVAVHVRRGDSLKNHTLARLTVDYYRQAAAAFGNCRYVVFSDDIPWCRLHLDLGYDLTFVEGEKDYVDLLLMARCDRYIIANSTFSWWAAYLNRKSNAPVAYPYPWFTGRKHRSRDMSDFFLPHWERYYSGQWLSL